MHLNPVVQLKTALDQEAREQERAALPWKNRRGGGRNALRRLRFSLLGSPDRPRTEKKRGVQNLADMDRELVRDNKAAKDAEQRERQELKVAAKRLREAERQAAAQAARQPKSERGSIFNFGGRNPPKLVAHAQPAEKSEPRGFCLPTCQSQDGELLDRYTSLPDMGAMGESVHLTSNEL